MVKRREFELFSLSFLDCICCGFGAIILLFILSMGAAKTTVRKTRYELEHTREQLRAALGVVQNERVKLTGEINSTEKSLQDVVTELATLQALLARLNEQIQNETSGKKALLTEVEQLKREIAAMQKEVPPDVPQIDTSKPIGVPVESNYIAFVIDTSGSMRDVETEMLLQSVVRKFDEVLRAYPVVKGIQFLDADGRFILGRGGWIEDSEEVRRRAFNAVRRYPIASQSNPVPGIVRAIRSLHDPDNRDMRMGIYVFGDEFVDTAEEVLDRIDRLNPVGPDGKRAVTINGIGFPNLLTAAFGLGQSGVKFANLMRELTTRHGGAFIAVVE